MVKGGGEAAGDRFQKLQVAADATLTIADPSASGGILPCFAAPEPADCTRPVDILVAGIGGSGVVTVGALLGMAAHLEGKGCSVLDVTGLAQKNGPVTSHVRIAQRSEQGTDGEQATRVNDVGEVSQGTEQGTHDEPDLHGHGQPGTPGVGQLPFLGESRDDGRR